MLNTRRRPPIHVKRPHWYDYRISSFGNYVPTYWRRDVPGRGGRGGGKSGRDAAGTSIIAYIVGAIGLFVGAAVLVAFL